MRRSVALTAVAVPLLLAASPLRADPGQSTPTQRSVPSTSERRALMRHHYLEVGEIHEAVIRGDLPGVHGPARRLAVMAILPQVPASLVPFMVTMRHAAGRAAEARSLSAAAAATTDLIAQCAGCHQAAGIRPAPVPRNIPDVGGIVGHMLEHERATDALLLGLLLPSASEWERGAGLLRSAEMHRSELPPDPKLSRDIMKAESAVHALATDALAATTPARRSTVYARVVTTCAQCHGLHRMVWGPRSVGP